MNIVHVQCRWNNFEIISAKIILFHMYHGLVQQSRS